MTHGSLPKSALPARQPIAYGIANHMDGALAGGLGMRRIRVEVITSGEALRRVRRAAKADKRSPPEPTIGVASIAQLSALLSPKRMELLRFVVQNPGLSVRALSKALKRDYKNVHSDVSGLEENHLVERDDDGKVSAPYDEIVIRAPLRDAA